MLRSNLTACLATVLLAGCTSSGPKAENQVSSSDAAGDANAMAGMGSMTPSDQDSAATKEYKQAMMASMQNTPPFTGDADRDFMQQMRVHHQAAIQMSETLLKHGKDQRTRALAQEIIKAQQREIAEINDWLSGRR
jgi:uncharacterized protein (DUF305 family)